jgi:prepilin-type N-terminal cleavage/methylation domain-containing protein
MRGTMIRFPLSKRPQSSSQRGFTVIELMVATAVFGFVLLIIATGILQLSRLYYKGLTETKVQTTTRTLVDTIAQAIQFSGANVTVTPVGAVAGATTWTFCIGNQQYAYKLGQQLVDSTPAANQSRRVLMVRDLAGCTASSGAPAMDGSAAGRELLAPGMRLARLEVKQLSGSYYTVSARVVFGDDAVLSTPPTATTAGCRNGVRAGTQFCAVSDITAGITKRVEYHDGFDDRHHFGGTRFCTDLASQPKGIT